MASFQSGEGENESLGEPLKKLGYLWYYLNEYPSFKSVFKESLENLFGDPNKIKDKLCFVQEDKMIKIEKVPNIMTTLE